MKDFLKQKGIRIDNEIYSSDGRKYHLSELLTDYAKSLQLLQTDVSGSAYIDGCKSCKHNKTGFDAGSWCINNCMSGNKFEHKDL